MKKTIYDFSVNNIKGQKISLEQYKWKVILVVNTASKCWLTPQYEWLEKLYQKYKDKNFVILGFPCNQFKNQEPWSSKDIQAWCLLNYGVSFDMFEKIDVNWRNASPLFKFLRKSLSGWFWNKVKWNFTKFLIDTNGTPVKRFAPTTQPEKLEKHIEKLI